MIATLYANAAGQLLSIGGLPNSIGTPPAPEATQSLDLDTVTNAALLNNLRVNWDAYRLNAGVLTRNGTPVPIAADGSRARERKQLAAIWTVLNSPDPLTQPQLKTILRILVREVATEFSDA